MLEIFGLRYKVYLNSTCETLIEFCAVQFEMIQVPSEGIENPTEKVLFYKKAKGKNHPPAVLMSKEVKDMVRICCRLQG